MKTMVEIHVLQNYAPSNLNRDDTGAPKDAIFGGTRRARISSQCVKRAVRLYFKDKVQDSFFANEELAIRTKRVIHDVAEKLAEHERSIEEAMEKTTVALSYLKLKTAKDNKTQYLLFLGKREIDGLALVIHEHWDEIAVDSGKSSDDEEKSKKKKGKKNKAEKAPKELKDRLEKLFDGGKAVDLALFGRMLADMPDKNQDAACQVAHAISTHAVEREFDYYTAVDDLKPDDTAGADMIGTVEFNSACFYRYAVVDWEKLVQNLQGDRELAQKGLKAFLEGFVISEPTGKQNTFAAHNPPEFVSVSIRKNACPRNLANAFELPVRASKGKSLTQCSVEELTKKANALDSAYGSAKGQSYVLNLGDANVNKLGKPVKSLDELLGKIDLSKE